MSPHLPYSERPEDEFLHPRGEWMYVLRALVTDSWLLWRHALPANPQSRALLGLAEAAWIEALGDFLHRLHQTLPSYPRLTDSPFEVQRWFDPHDPGTPWAEGRRCRFRIQGFGSPRIVQAAKEQPGARWLAAVALDESWVEATALAIPVRGRAQRSRGSGRKETS